VTPLAAADIAAAAERLGVEVAALSAVDDIESRDSGFLADGRPVILFERHIMYRRLKKCGARVDALATRYPALVNKDPGGYKSGAAEWYRLSLAREIDRRCADESTSWGRYQIMGIHWQTLGFADSDAFVGAMSATEAAQLDAFCRFIEVDPRLHAALRDKDWPVFARLYNGPGYRQNAYDTKLAAAYARNLTAAP
jgi:hypothetical protein